MKSPERELWAAVILNAVTEANWNGEIDRWASNGASYWKRSAHDWLTGGTPDFHLVCNLAGLDGHAVKAAYLAGKLKQIGYRNGKRGSTQKGTAADSGTDAEAEEAWGDEDA